MGFDKSDFVTKLLAIIKTIYPDLVIVQRYQNTTQPVDIYSGAQMMDIEIERVVKRGTDWNILSDDKSSIVWYGDREVEVVLELFAPDALEKLLTIRDMFETHSYRQLMNQAGFMEIRTYDEPRSSTRLHGISKFVESAIYETKFATTVNYIDAVGIGESKVLISSIEHGEITGNVIP